MENKRMEKTRLVVVGAIMTALVATFQALGTVTTFFGPFSTAVGLIPIVVGTALCGTAVGTWLGFVFGVVVLLSGGAALFLAFNVPGTFITVLLKGLACGFAAGLVYKPLSKKNRFLAVLASAIICPIVNTSVFLLGCRVFFYNYADAIAGQLGMNVSGMALFWALAMGNFLFEIGANIVLSPVIVRVLNVVSKNKI